MTRLLTNYLGGSAKTFMMITVCPDESKKEDTITTLRFATRAKHIQSVPLYKEFEVLHVYCEETKVQTGVEEEKKQEVDEESAAEESARTVPRKDKKITTDQNEEETIVTTRSELKDGL